MGDFVSAAQLATFLQADVDTASANSAIDDAEALVRTFCRQTLSQASSTDALLAVSVADGAAFIDLPECPVSAVSSVQVNGTAYTADVDYQWPGGQRIYLSHVASPAASFAVMDTATVSYAHGFASGTSAFESVAAVVRSVAGRIYDNPRGMRQESVEGYTYIRGGGGDDILGGALSQAERASLQRFRRQVASIVVA